MDENKEEKERPIAPRKREQTTTVPNHLYIIYHYLPSRSDMTSSAAVTKKSKHDKPSSQAVQLEDIVIDDQAPEKARKKKSREQQHDTSHKKGKKRKKIDAEEQVESMEHKAQLEAEGESGPPKKKHKNRTNFSDPREDMQLNMQSRKGAHYTLALIGWILLLSTALEYVFTQMNRPSRWKFNKARQNWLIRNVWSSESVS
jgi:hypothetical protein